MCNLSRLDDRKRLNEECFGLKKILRLLAVHFNNYLRKLRHIFTVYKHKCLPPYINKICNFLYKNNKIFGLYCSICEFRLLDLHK